MELSSDQKKLCADWVSSPNRKWQTLNRAQWKYIFHEKTMVRFVEEVKMDEDIVPLLLEYLTSDDCKETLQLYGQAVSDEWTPIRAWYEISNKAAGSVHAVRLYHALTTEPEENEDGPYLVEDGCAYKVSFTYYWKVAEPPTVPASTSGVSYRLSFQREPDTGLYNATIEKRERVQQDIPMYVRELTIYERGEEETHIGVKQDDVSSTGLEASVDGGVLVTRKLSKNDDCTSNVANTRTTELPVQNAEVTRSKRLHAVTVSRTDRNQQTAITDDSSALVVGETRRSRKTPGGLYDNTHEQTDIEEVGLIGEDCSKTIFDHGHKTHSNVVEKPTPAEASAAGGGHTYAKSSRQTEYGTWDVSETDNTELPVSASTKRYQKTLHGTVETTEDRNQGSSLDGGGMKVGETRQSVKTPGGLYNNTKSLVVNDPAGKIGEAGTEDRHSRTVSETVNQMEMENTAPSFSDGEIVRKTSNLNSDGTADVQTHTVTAKPSMNRYSWTDDNGTHTKIVYRNQPTEKTNLIPASADSSSASDNINDFGLHDGTVAWFNYGSSSSSGGSLVFIRHGRVVKAWQMRMRPPKNIREVREVQLQLTIHYGDARTDMFSDALAADANRENNGVVMIRRIPYEGGARGLVAWISVDLAGINNWEDFDPGKHGFCPYSMSVADMARSMLNGVKL